MIADNKKIEFKAFEGYSQIPEDKFTVELLDINEVDSIGKFSKPGDTNFVFKFVLLEGEDADGETLRGRSISAKFVPTELNNNPKAKNFAGKNELWRILEALSGVEVKEDDKGFQGEVLNALIGEQCIIFTKFVPDKKDPKIVYTNISNYKVANKKLAPLTEEEKARFKGSETPSEKVEDVLAEAVEHLG